MDTRLKFLYVFLFTSFTLQGADFLSIKLNSLFSYRDLSIYCSSTDLPQELILNMELEGSKPTRAVFNKRGDQSSDPIEMSAAEMSTISLYQSSEEESRIKSITLSNRLLIWIFFHMGGELSGCKLTEPIESITPEGAKFYFENKKSQSDIHRFEGYLKNTDGYQAELSFIQE